MALGGGINFYGFSAFFVPLSEEFGWSRSVLSGVFALSRLEGGLLGPVEGWLIDRFGPRKLMLIGIPLMGLGFILLSRVNSLFSLYMVYILAITFGGGLGTFAPAGAAVANWFVKKRGRALGVIMSGVAVGGGILLPLIGWWITRFGWRHAAVAAGIFIIILGIPIASIMRHRPEQYGQLPDGEQPSNELDNAISQEELSAADSNPIAPLEFTAREAIKTSAFWFLGASLSVRSLTTTGLTIHFVAMMVDRGFSLTLGSTLLGLVAMTSVIGRVGLPSIGDKLDKRYLMAITYVAMGISMVGMAYAQSTLWVFVLLFIYSVTYGGIIVLPLSLQAEYFGRYSFATVRGVMNTVQTSGMLAGPIFAGIVYDLTKSYDIAFMGFGIASFLAALLIIGARRPKSPYRIGY